MNNTKKELLNLINNLEYGEIKIKIHQGRIKLIEKIEKIKI